MFGLARKSTISPLVQDALGTVLTDRDMLLMSGAGTQLELSAGSTFIVEGTTGADALLILSGTAAVSRSDELVANLCAGDLVGEESLISGAPRNATVIATTDVVALQLTRQEFAWLCLFSTNFGELAQRLSAARSQD